MKTKVGIIYSSVDGHTLKICKKLNALFNENQIETELFSIDTFTEEISKYHTLIIGASIRYGNHKTNVTQFIQTNKNELNKITTAFFSVNLVARKKEKNSINTNPYFIKYIKKVNWNADFQEVFAGKLDYNSYSFFDKIMIKLIMKLTHGPTKSDVPIEYTDWNKVEQFGLKIIANYKNTNQK